MKDYNNIPFALKYQASADELANSLFNINNSKVMDAARTVDRFFNCFKKISNEKPNK